MKDVSLKPDSLRTASATATLRAPQHCIERLRSGDTEKGDPVKTARIAGILAAKRTDELIPLCHPLPIYRADLRFELGEGQVEVISEVETIAPTGVEMEALTATSIAVLTLYDMLKPYCEPEELEMTSCRLLLKKGGKSQFRRKLRVPATAAVIVLSDTVSARKKPDTAGAGVRDDLAAAGFDPLSYEILPDEAEQLLASVKAKVNRGVDLIVTVGGTGMGSRDITVDTLKPLITRELPGMMEAARAFGQRRTPFALMSRGVAGFIGNSLLITCPGSRRGALETLAPLLPGLIHIFEVCRHDKPHPGGYTMDIR
ncbi:bifunctional molybdenum cofactor biosynthesis protein MoaC/MoaB [Solimonas sp. SE-A11]|uniref:bifunctional molybdenum cofactor biosynthesis protein MoaC/MoaB n=1 Tax=Solimonas sp. SE-A11 TaxID=3054954 RepID=UPI00259CB150|nr:bifunctional molybdenum cofactor biosynthesis protein MoaC/MoaB [Solimonas sp. SE-A11]MDM4769573.1 bifunctional molybdenum cofactor biosynthesis protein MoaC/MoaB [Solimonas sp. SE-A11]